MIKKLISLCTICLALSGICTVNAEQTQTDISVVQNGYTIVVKVGLDKAAGGAVAVFIKSGNAEDTTYYGMDDTTSYTESDGKFIYEIPMKMGENVSSGEYIAYVDNGDIIQKHFTYVSISEKVSFFNKLNTAPVSEIFGLITGAESKVSYDLSEYKSLNEKIRGFADAEISNWDLSATDVNIDEIEKKFSDNMDEMMIRAKLGSADGAAFDSAVKAAVELGKLDGTYYERITSGSVSEFMNTDAISGISYDELSKHFSEAVLMAAYRNMDYLFLREVYLYSANNGTVSIDNAKLSQLKNKKLDTDLFREVKKVSGLETVTQLKSTVDSKMDYLLKSSGESDNRGSGSGGGGGASGISGSVSSMGQTTEAVPSETKNTKLPGDLDSVLWAKDAISSLVKAGVINGHDDGNFYPNDAVTREEFVKMLIIVFGAVEVGSVCDFSDVESNRWSAVYIASASRLGVVNGVDETRFEPTGKITREDMAAMIYRAYNIVNKTYAEAEPNFDDASDISDYAKGAVAELVRIGALNGVGNGLFEPKGIVTRAQAAQALYNISEVLK